MNILKIYKKGKAFLVSNCFLFFVLLIFVFLISYQTSFAAETFRKMVERLVNSIKQPIISLISTAALATFVWGIVKYIKGGEMEKESAKELIVWGLLGITVITSVWAFVDAMKNTLGL